MGEGARPQSLAAQKNQDGERKETLGWTRALARRAEAQTLTGRDPRGALE